MRFTFGSDTNQRLFVNWLLDHPDKRFEIDGAAVLVPVGYLDDETLREARDLGAVMTEVG